MPELGSPTDLCVIRPEVVDILDLQTTKDNGLFRVHHRNKWEVSP